MDLEEKQAYQDLTMAIERIVKLRDTYDDSKPWALGEYLVITARHTFDAEGEQETAIGYLYRDDAVPFHTVIGLLEVARVRMQKFVTED